MIGVELLAAGTIDTVVVPLGDGALITGIAAWIKDRFPRTQIIGVCPGYAGNAACVERSARDAPSARLTPHLSFIPGGEAAPSDRATTTCNFQRY